MRPGFQLAQRTEDSSREDWRVGKSGPHLGKMSRNATSELNMHPAATAERSRKRMHVGVEHTAVSLFAWVQQFP
jgi:hypothetical protein